MLEWHNFGVKVTNVGSFSISGRAIMKILVISNVRYTTNGITSVIMNYFRNMVKDNMSFEFIISSDIEDDIYEELLTR